jgi:aminoglycoside phosphotransferase (APT) family kinase protein
VLSLELAKKLVAEQFPQWAHLRVEGVEQQGHDNRTYRLGNDKLIRMPTAQSYALNVLKEQDLLPKLAPYLRFKIPIPLQMGMPSLGYPHPFSIYEWMPGKSLNLLHLKETKRDQLAFDLSCLLKELQAITEVKGPMPGQHNWWRGAHPSVYHQSVKNQLTHLDGVIESKMAMEVWKQACDTQWHKAPVWLHGDIAVGNILILEGTLSAIIDFGSMAMGDPACDLVMAWTFFHGTSRNIFVREMALDRETWLRARAWALWKATFELSRIKDHDSQEALAQKSIIHAVIHES